MATGDASPLDVRAVESARLARADRREVLLDAASMLILEGDVEDASMEAVADRAGVSRALVYKHFANRSEMLTAVYRREAALLHEEIASEVRTASSLEDMYRALVRSSLRASEERGDLFVALRAAGARNPDLRREQRARDRETVKAFAVRAVRELGIPRVRAQSGTAMLLTCLDSIMIQWRARPTKENAAALEEIYLEIVAGGLNQLARSSDL